MTISVDGPSQIITVPKADTVLTGTDPTTGRELRTYDSGQFHIELREWGDTEAGRAFAGGGFPTHTYQTNILGSITYAPTLEVLSPWRVTFEDGTYQVSIEGTNNNIHLVATVNQVQIVPGNSAGLQIVTQGSGLSAAQALQLADLYRRLGLDAANPLTNKKDGSVSATGIDIVATQSGDDIIQTRQ